MHSAKVGTLLALISAYLSLLSSSSSAAKVNCVFIGVCRHLAVLEQALRFLFRATFREKKLEKAETEPLVLQVTTRLAAKVSI